MAQARRFSQLDVFTAVPLLGNPLAVVHDGGGLSDVQMASFANWTHLSRRPSCRRRQIPMWTIAPHSRPSASPPAGHSTLGSCYGSWPAAWRDDGVVQECGAGLVRIRRDGVRLAFAASSAPAAGRSGGLIERIERGLALARGEIVDHQWVDNGPGWWRCSGIGRTRAAAEG
jgi:PhzF family phenazine biosynthesis protein